MVAVPSLYDTNILIDYLNGLEAARTELESDVAQDRAISAITWMEVMVGVPQSLEAPVRRFLSTFKHLPVTRAVSEEAFTIRRQSRVKLPDAIMLATARAHNRVLVTRNTRDFPVQTIGFHVPYTL
ncbi:type II toxin-antitoxin system VapC family toxin [Granulicella tundricola]|uniref:Ribonuclease VapC n=1 Tax=Granulicella tundricola (strain ATCC BAA-1859 / DSM 23138 / MP5ACTX9) TaxID=1198114 RepID=E8X6H6_GRATM|nr:type II toxin-antitoxin system VapC family toxin [Granulicella tundricola]ADW71060.1 PilT protein domain protein [Granulicella tundricola MP5ACTX9]